MLKFVSFLFISVIASLDLAYASSSSDAEALEDSFHDVKYTNRGAEFLFPQRFTDEQVQCLFDKQPLLIQNRFKDAADEVFDLPVGALSAEEKFYREVMPNRLQLITGTAARYASKIRFANAVEVHNGALQGLYEYVSSYDSLYSMAGYGGCLSFLVQLRLDPSYVIYGMENIEGRCRVFNMRESILGDKDFLSSERQLNMANRMLPVTSLHYLKSLDRNWVRQTNEIGRLAGNTKDWLLLLHALQGNNVHGMDEVNRQHIADSLYEKFLTGKEYAANEMNLAKYEDCLMSLRQSIFEKLGIREDQIPTVPADKIVDMCEGRVFFAVAE